MSDVYYIIGGVAYGILQFIISWVAGISKVDAETTIARTEQEKIAEIKEAEAKAKEAELNATVIVPANKAKEKAIIDAEAVKQEAILKAEAKANASNLKLIRRNV